MTESTTGNTENNKWIDKKEWDYFTSFKHTPIKYMKAEQTIKYTPREKTILVKDSKEAGIAANTSLITSDKISDADAIRYGGVSKAASMANKSSEQQDHYTVLKVRKGVDDYFIGDEIIFQGGAQAHSVKIGEDYYLQVGVYDILGKFN